MTTKHGRVIPTAKVSPKDLHENSAIHTSPFSAIAELIDNACQPDVSARDLWINYEEVNGKPCLVIQDNGSGIDLQRLQHMLSFGSSEKEKQDKVPPTPGPAGHCGKGFKSGSMRLAKDALVFSVHKASRTACIGLLSQTLCEDRMVDLVILPMVEFSLPNFERRDNDEIDMVESVKAILEVSPYSSQKELEEQLRQLSKAKQGTRSGTKIVLFGLKRVSNGLMELDFNSCEQDIRTRETKEQTSQKGGKTWQYRQSLRSYCSILYKKPWMKIHVRGKKVDHFLMTETLQNKRLFTYKPKGSEKSMGMLFGRLSSRGRQRLEDFGIMFYHGNRLIRPYVKIGRMKKGEAEGVVGVVDTTGVLTLTDDKQGFVDNIVYRAANTALLLKLDAFCAQGAGHEKEEDERDKGEWLQCDKCNKWRRLPPSAVTWKQTPKKWFCTKNPDHSRNRCDVEEEAMNYECDLKGGPKGKKHKLPDLETKKDEKRPRDDSKNEGSAEKALAAGAGHGETSANILLGPPSQPEAERRLHGLNQYQSDMALRRKLRRFLTFLVSNGIVNIEEMGSEEDVEDVLERAMDYFGVA